MVKNRNRSTDQGFGLRKIRATFINTFFPSISAKAAKETSIRVVLRKYWRIFLPVWICPALFIVVTRIAWSYGFPLQYIWLVFVLLFFFSFFRAMRPLRRGEVSLVAGTFCVTLLPFLVTVMLFFLYLVVYILLKKL